MKNSIRHFREAKGYTQQELAEIVGCSRQTINAIENNDGKNPSIQLMVLISKALDQPIEELLLWDDSLPK